MENAILSLIFCSYTTKQRAMNCISSASAPTLNCSGRERVRNGLPIGGKSIRLETAAKGVNLIHTLSFP